MEKKLTAKEKLFCEEYIVDLNQTQAAIRAGYSAKTACSIGSQNLRKLHIQEYIASLKSKRNEKLNITQEKIINNLLYAMEIATGERNTFVPNRDGTSDELKKTDLPSYLKLQEMLGKHIGFFEKDNKEKEGTNKIIINLGNGDPTDED
jgi:phage terminase small subunit